MFNDDEKRLKYCLAFDANSADDVFVRSEAIHFIKSEFLRYWIEMDKAHNSEFYDTIEKLYLSDNAKSYVEIASEIGYTVRTLKRYREKFVDKINELIDVCRRMISDSSFDDLYKPLS